MNSDIRKTLKAKGVNMTRALREAVCKYDLSLVHVGTLSYKGNRYVKSTFFPISDVPDTEKKNCLIGFNHFENGQAGWTSWETRLMTFREAMEIWKQEKDRRLWDSRVFYFLDGNQTYCVF